MEVLQNLDGLDVIGPTPMAVTTWILEAGRVGPLQKEGIGPERVDVEAATAGVWFAAVIGGDQQCLQRRGDGDDADPHGDPEDIGPPSCLASWPGHVVKCSTIAAGRAARCRCGQMPRPMSSAFA